MNRQSLSENEPDESFFPMQHLCNMRRLFPQKRPLYLEMQVSVYKRDLCNTYVRNMASSFAGDLDHTSHGSSYAKNPMNERYESLSTTRLM